MFNEHLPNDRAALGALRDKCYHYHFTGEENKASFREKVSNAWHSQALNSLKINENHPTENKHLQVLLLWGSALDSSGVSMEAILKLFGEYFFKFCKKSGYDRMLRTLGGNLTEFIENLDALHSYLALSYKVRCLSLVFVAMKGSKCV